VVNLWLTYVTDDMSAAFHDRPAFSFHTTHECCVLLLAVATV